MKGAIIGDIAGSVYEFDKTADSLDIVRLVWHTCPSVRNA